ncbi:MAG: hypothetical protein KGL61_16115, partial [Burkholderiales bacterium]|nr:hypothetical protein [Burkholderiales bacterium]
MPNPLQRAEIGQAALSLVDETPIPAGYEAEGVKWGGCATLNPDDPKLWIVAKTDRARTNDEVHGFTLAEVIEARLRAKIVGLAESDRNAAIADCVEDTLYHIKTLVFGGANERADLANSNESENHTMQNGESAMKEADAPSTATEEFLGC